MAELLRINIADIIFSVNSKNPLKFKKDKVQSLFSSKSEPEIILQVREGIPSFKDLGKKIFDSEGTWSLYRSNKINILRFNHSNAFPKWAIFDSSFKHGDIYIGDYEPSRGYLPFLLNYPLDQILMINLLSLGRGILLHACGIAYNEKAILFVGGSGAGKSSLAKLWTSEKGAVILNDDRIIIRKIDNLFWAYGTPWHGSIRTASAQKVPLSKIFFIKHDNMNNYKLLNKTESVSKLMVYSFSPLWDRKGMKFTLRFIDGLTRRIQCYDLGFLPQRNAIDLIKSI